MPQKRDKLGPVSYLNLVSWNIAGLSGKLDDPGWRDYISAFEVCLFQETWALEECFMEGFGSFSIPAKKSKKGRPKGGLTIWLSSTLMSETVPIETGNPNVMCLHVAKEGFMDLIIFNIYNRDIGSDGNSEVFDTIAGLMSRLTAEDVLAKGSPTFLWGGFQCKIGL